MEISVPFRFRLTRLDTAISWMAYLYAK
jgi:hypothetical protein